MLLSECKFAINFSFFLLLISHREGIRVQIECTIELHPFAWDGLFLTFQLLVEWFHFGGSVAKQTKLDEAQFDRITTQCDDNK